MTTMFPLGPGVLRRSIRLKFRADWGQGHMTKSCCWLMQELEARTGAFSEFSVHNGNGGIDNVRAVGRGQVDVALTSPRYLLPRLAVEGKGPFVDEAYPDLRALGLIPQDDRMVVALDASLGIRSFEELRERKPALRIATGPDDGVSVMGYAARILLDAAGITAEELASWGGGFVYSTDPWPCLRQFEAGEVDAVVQEGLTAPYWKAATDARDTAFLPIEEHVLDELEQRYYWTANTLEAGYFRGLEEPLRTLDFSDFVVLVRADMPDDLAYLITWCMTETKRAIERQYAHRDPRRTGISYPLVPSKMRQTPIALHPGAQAAYDDLGY